MNGLKHFDLAFPPKELHQRKRVVGAWGFFIFSSSFSHCFRPSSGRCHLLVKVLLTLGAAFVCFRAVAEWPFAHPDPQIGYARDHLLIKFKPDKIDPSASAREWNAVLAQFDLPAGADLMDTSFRVLTGQPVPAGASEKSSAPTDLNRHLFLRLPPGVDALETVQKLTANPLLEYIELDGIGTAATTIPTDPFFVNQWHHRNTAYTNGVIRADIHTPEAWDITQGSSNVIVAVLDTGVHAALPEFDGRLLPGHDFVRGDDNPDDETGHGTAVALVLGASANNAMGIAGVDWKCKLMPLKVVDTNDLFFDAWVAAAVDWATTSGCKVINMSLGKYGSSESIARAITNAIAKGLIVVSLTSNDGTNQISFPGNLAEVITVGATDLSDRRADFSNYGPEIDLVAPGVGICTLHRDGSLWCPDGTSLSAPMVSGAAALLAAMRSDINNEMARTLLCAGADDLVGHPSEDTPGFDIYHGWGRLNVYNSVVLSQTRLERLQVTPNRQILFAWTCPPNAEGKQLYRIEFANSMLGPWKTLAAHSDITYSGTRACWIDDHSQTGGLAGILKDKFFRIRVSLE